MSNLLITAPVAELVDAPDSKSGIERCTGSIPVWGTSSVIEMETG